ncbi:MAG: hypothetical protein U1E98_05645 [Moraxella osloensis]
MTDSKKALLGIQILISRVAGTLLLILSGLTAVIVIFAPAVILCLQSVICMS